MVEVWHLHAAQIAWGAGVFGLSLGLSLAAMLFVLLRLASDHFHHARHPSPFWEGRPAWLRAIGLAGKNLLGFFLVVLGVVMSLPGVPGQGLLTIFIGLVLMDVPGKRAIERRIVSVPAIFRACNRLRARFDKPPFTLDGEDVRDQAERLEGKASTETLTRR